MVRGMSEQWGLDAPKVGLLGFSAGGSLSARASTQYEQVLYEPIDAFDGLSARPDFFVLIYLCLLGMGVQVQSTTSLDLTLGFLNI